MHELIHKNIIIYLRFFKSTRFLQIFTVSSGNGTHGNKSLERHFVWEIKPQSGTNNIKN